MRIVTWNMGCGPRASAYRKQHSEAWTYLLTEQPADVYLLQETLVPHATEASSRGLTVCELAHGVDAGTVVLVRGEIPIADAPRAHVSEETYVATTTIGTAAGPLALCSVHVYTGARYFSDLAAIPELLATTFADTPLMVGGDFNCARSLGGRYAEFFEKMAAAGFHDAHFAQHGREVQSFWRPGTKNSLQDDHIFVSQGLADRIRSCRVIDDETVRRVSDHGPVALELDVPAA